MKHCSTMLKDLDTRKIGAEYLESFEILCWRRMDKIEWSVKVTNQDVLESIKEKRTLLNKIQNKKANLVKF